MKKQIFFIILSLLIVGYFLGPKPATPAYKTDLSKITLTLTQLNDSIDAAEAGNKKIKLDNEARIIWADSVPQQTAWAIVYLHGFTASQIEGDPVHRHIAKTFGMNLFLARLNDHGLESDSALLNLTPDRLWESAKQALVIGRKLGKKVILMSTSTGGTLGLKLAATYPDKVDALINYSPNIRINNPMAGMMNGPWGAAILRAISDKGYYISSGNEDSLISQYWNTKYRVEALTQLEELVETTMNKETFASVTCPVLTLAYYKDEKNQDPTVKVSAMRWMHGLLATAPAKNIYEELPSVGVHPFASYLRSDNLAIVELKTEEFIGDVLMVSPVN